jgi:hypothetical protein
MSAYCTILERKVGFDAIEVNALKRHGKKSRDFEDVASCGILRGFAGVYPFFEREGAFHPDK